MSTKFAQRPAPRKRPWICKRSPPCLRPAPTPETFICTFAIRRFNPPPATETYSGSMLLRWDEIMEDWRNTTFDPPNLFDCVFNYTPATGACLAQTEFKVGPFLDDGAWDVTNCGPWPKMFYYSRNVVASLGDWTGTLQITG